MNQAQSTGVTLVNPAQDTFLSKNLSASLNCGFVIGAHPVLIEKHGNSMITLVKRWRMLFRNLFQTESPYVRRVLL